VKTRKSSDYVVDALAITKFCRDDMILIRQRHPYSRGSNCCPLPILGQQPIQNAASTPTMFIIVIDPFCCNQTLRLGPTYITFALPLRRATNLSPECTKPRIKFQKISGGDTLGPTYTGCSAPRPQGRGKGGKGDRGKGKGGEREEEKGREEKG